MQLYVIRKLIKKEKTLYFNAEEEEDKFSLALITSSTRDFDRVPQKKDIKICSVSEKSHKKALFWTDSTKLERSV